MPSDEHEEGPERDGPSDDDIPEGAFSPTEDPEPEPAPPVTPKAVASASKPPISYWQAVISELPPTKQAAAWEFFQEHELGVARGGTDTLSGMMLLMEANGLFMDACAKRLAVTAKPSASPEDATKALTPVVEVIRGDLAGIKQDVLTQITEALALYRVDVAKGQTAPTTTTTATPEETPLADGAATAPPRPSGRRFAPWIFAGLVALATGAAGAYFGDRHARQAADLEIESQVKTRMSQIKAWIDTEEEAKAVLMSRKATLSFDFARDPSLKDHKVYTLTVKGVPVVRAGKTKEGDGVIAWESNVPDLFTQ